MFPEGGEYTTSTIPPGNHFTLVPPQRVTPLLSIHLISSVNEDSNPQLPTEKPPPPSHTEYTPMLLDGPNLIEEDHIFTHNYNLCPHIISNLYHTMKLAMISPTPALAPTPVPRVAPLPRIRYLSKRKFLPISNQPIKQLLNNFRSIPKCTHTHPLPS